MNGAELLAPRRPAFWTHAACRRPHAGADWFPEQGRSAGIARDVCAGCPVRQACLDWALDQGPWLQGIYGGLTQRQRRDLMRRAS